MGLFKDFFYCVDTSALIDLKKTYPRNIFPSLWENFEKLISEGRIIAPREVLKELEQYADKTDVLLKWVKKNKKMFKDLDEAQLQHVSNILSNHPNFANAGKQGPHADPFIVALAISEGCSVITQESQTKVDKIPDICRKYDIKSLSLIGFFTEQKWKF